MYLWPMARAKFDFAWFDHS